MLQDTTLDLFKFSPFPVLAAALRTRSARILSDWQDRTREGVSAAGVLSEEQIRDDLPLVLAELANTLEAADGSPMPSFTRVATAHGEDRIRHCYTTNEFMIEYALLRPIAIDQVTEQLGRPMTVAEAAAFNMGIDTALRTAVNRCVGDQQEALRVVSDAQTKYLSFLSHDLRGGLNGVMLTAELLKRQLSDDPRFAESIDDIDSMRRAILDTVATMDRFLHAERFRQGKVRPATTRVEIGPLLSHFGINFSAAVKEKQIELRLRASDGLAVTTDRHLLSLILQNLISNAIKYTNDGVVEVVAGPSAGGAGVSVSVSDAGPGIEAERLPMLFEAFTRGDTHGQPGVGLGLYIVRQAADLIGAKIVVQSSDGQGTTFQVELPDELEV